MLTTKAIAHFGEGYRGVKALADALGISPQAVYQWGERVPEGRAYQLQVITGGRLTVDDVPRGTVEEEKA